MSKTKQGYPEPEDRGRWNKNFNKKPKAEPDDYMWGKKKDLPPELPPDRSGTRKPFNLGRPLSITDFDLNEFSDDELNKALDFFDPRKNPPKDMRENP